MTRARLLPTTGAPLELAVIVPVRNEAENIPLLVEMLGAALDGLVWEVIVVDDDSPDGTSAAVRALALHDPRVRVLQRIGRRGLSSAVVEGMMASAAPVLAVIDGDLQHDETILPSLYEAIARDGYDLAVGTRYAKEGSTGEWSVWRVRISRFATRLSRRLLRADLSDPMSGFFAIRRDAAAAAVPYLSNIGFKLLMDLVASSPASLATIEIPYTFRGRIHGESKLDARVAQEFAILILEKLFGRFLPVRFLMFAMVGSLGLAVHLAVLGASLSVDLPFRVAQTIAVGIAMTFNFFLNNVLTYRDIRLRGARLWRGLLSFYAIGMISAVGNVGVGTMVYRSERVWWIAGLAGAAVGVVWNYATSAAVTWRTRR